MILESQVEQKFVNALSSVSELSGYQIMQSRKITDEGIRNADADDTVGVILVATGFRSHDQFSLTPITLPVNVSIVTRTEVDYTSKQHEEAIEAIANLFSYWHKFPQPMTTALTTDKFSVGELRIDGGSGRTYNKTDSVFTENIKLTLRGSEIFNN